MDMQLSLHLRTVRSTSPSVGLFATPARAQSEGVALERLRARHVAAERVKGRSPNLVVSIRSNSTDATNPSGWEPGR